MSFWQRRRVQLNHTVRIRCKSVQVADGKVGGSMKGEFADVACLARRFQRCRIKSSLGLSVFVFVIIVRAWLITVMLFLGEAECSSLEL